MTEAVKIVEVKFNTASRPPNSTSLERFYRAQNKPVPAKCYTYLIPDGVDIEVGDEIIVPVGPYNLSRRVTVTKVSTLDYKYAIGKVELF